MGHVSVVTKQVKAIIYKKWQQISMHSSRLIANIITLRIVVVELAFSIILCVVIKVANKFCSLAQIRHGDFTCRTCLAHIRHTDFTWWQTCIRLGNSFP